MIDDERTLGRVRRMTLERILPAVHSPRVPMTAEWVALPGEPEPPAEAMVRPRAPYRTGDPWGPAWSTAWFRFEAEVPSAWAGRDVEAIIDLGFDTTLPGFQCEGLAYTPEGRPIKGVNPRNQVVPLLRRAEGGERVAFFVEAAANPRLLDHLPLLPTDLGDVLTAPREPMYAVTRMDLAARDREVEALAADLDALVELVGVLPASARRSEILVALDAAMDALDAADVAGTASAARSALAPVLARPAAPGAHRISAIGHAHIDSAWLWPVRETVRKVARTVSSMTTLIDEDPDFVYGMSSAQQYAWLKQHRPEVYERLRRAVAGGRFVPLGGMWVESDAVMPSGESMIRQFAQGQRFFREEFGVRCEGVWLPDTFGFSGGLPQLIRRSGFRWFLSQKLSWNEVNDFPFSTFEWEGIDGTRVFSHFPPIDTYNARLSGVELERAATGLREAGRASGSIAPVGWGDGGGGTTREMAGRVERFADLEGAPRVVWERPDDFFARAAAELTEPPVWVGELVLEAHRGTLTSQHRTKQGNRVGERLLGEAELWCATAAARTGALYPSDELDELWRILLLNQFHDILPGSSIAWVYRDSAAQYAELERRAEALIAGALAALTGADVGAGSDSSELVVNSSAVARSGLAAFSAAPAASAVAADVTPRPTDDGGAVFENALVRVVLDAAGRIVEARDLATGVDLVPEGMPGAVLESHPDYPNTRDAWDVEPHDRRRAEPLPVDGSRLAIGADSATVEHALGDSAVSLSFRLGVGSRVLRIDQRTDWREHERMLRVAFPLALHAATTSAETQFGVVERPTHANTSWQTAQFERAMHRFVHLAEGSGGAGEAGAAVLTESTYGYDVRRRPDARGRVATVLGLSLLRGPRFPDPEADRGEHRHAYGLAIGVDLAAATAEGIAFSAPLRRAAGAPIAPLVRLEGGAVVSSVKLADDRSGDLVVRVYEPVGRRAQATLVVDAAFGPAHPVTPLEEELPADRADGDPAPHDVRPGVDAGATQLLLAPFEVVTLRFPAAGGR